MAPIQSEDFKPTKSQTTTLVIIAIYFVVILIFWNVKYLNTILWPFKIFTVGLHELSHAIAGKLTGAKIESIKIDADEGGSTVMRGGKRWATLPAGYIGSSIFGALMIFCGFNEQASKICAIVIGISMILLLWYAKNWIARIITVIFVGLIALAWYLEGGKYLIYVVLFLGVMSCFYSLWDIVEDVVLHKINESDASKFAKLFCHGCMPAQVWGFFWFIYSLIILVLAIVLALYTFRDRDNNPNTMF
ncbi:hypothetical protein BCR32DRAFT_267583 [Anaeromyces robustus]|jgi:hypothetical protein|uniref:Peptidase M50B-like protein n=1 Tax=Anaeromyces robustus TaxID=1754192 RepID=A0A1Y1X9P9_9FUNG|nr:hypothetical protein BCR32DRAFT_267583 [Anaeromyces robustus]|eukprot:ORX82501.1 hypothetical protein BCR32DRAFT_267583 [Anaeromyces robustus]